MRTKTESIMKKSLARKRRMRGGEEPGMLHDADAEEGAARTSPRGGKAVILVTASLTMRRIGGCRSSAVINAAGGTLPGGAWFHRCGGGHSSEKRLRFSGETAACRTGVGLVLFLVIIAVDFAAEGAGVEVAQGVVAGFDNLEA